MTREIPLTRGAVALVDDEDYEPLMRRKWALGTNGYASGCRSLGKNKSSTEYMHRAVANAPKGVEVDHVNGNKLDNRRANLRLCNRSGNVQNRGKGKGAVPYIGVYLTKHTGRYFAYVNIDRKRHALGCYTTAEEAARIRDAAAIRYHGDFARLNFPDLRASRNPETGPQEDEGEGDEAPAAPYPYRAIGKSVVYVPTGRPVRFGGFDTRERARRVAATLNQVRP